MQLDLDFPNLTNENLVLYAARAYDSPHNITAEFAEDFRRLKFTKRLLLKYRRTGDLSERLLLNHVIVLRNCFGTAAIRMLFLRIDEEDYSALKTILSFLSFLPLTVKEIDGKMLDTRIIPFDPNVVKVLKAI